MSNERIIGYLTSNELETLFNVKSKHVVCNDEGELLRLITKSEFEEMMDINKRLSKEIEDRFRVEHLKIVNKLLMSQSNLDTDFQKAINQCLDKQIKGE